MGACTANSGNKGGRRGDANLACLAWVVWTVTAILLDARPSLLHRRHGRISGAPRYVPFRTKKSCVAVGLLRDLYQTTKYVNRCDTAVPLFVTRSIKRSSRRCCQGSRHAVDRPFSYRVQKNSLNHSRNPTLRAHIKSAEIVTVYPKQRTCTPWT